MPTIDLGNIKFSWRGTWSSSTSYVVDDVVHVNPHSYICIQNNSGVTPTTGGNNSHWQIMAKGHGNQLTSSDTPENVRDTSRFRVEPYDYISGRGNGGSSHSMNKAWGQGKVWFTHGGNSSSHGSSSWNYKTMYESDCSHNDVNKGFRIKVPAGTDAVVVSSHDGHHYWSLTDPDTGQGVCKEGCSYQNKYFTYSGQYTTTNTLGAFGAKGTAERYHPEAIMAVPNLSYEKQYILTCYRPSQSRHGNSCSSRWMSGIAFIKNPWGLVYTSSMTAYMDMNGPGNEVWHSSWDWNNQALAFVHHNNARWVKVPVAPGAGGRMLFFKIHGQNHPQQLLRTHVGGKDFQFHPMTGSIPSSMLHGSKNMYWEYVECYIPENRIPAAVRTSGGVLDVYLDNNSYDHHWYFGEHGTYFTEPTAVVRDDD